MKACITYSIYRYNKPTLLNDIVIEPIDTKTFERLIATGYFDIYLSNTIGENCRFAGGMIINNQDDINTCHNITRIALENDK